jgi:hypothetical protein
MNGHIYIALGYGVASKRSKRAVAVDSAPAAGVLVQGAPQVVKKLKKK